MRYGWNRFNIDQYCLEKQNSTDMKITQSNYFKFAFRRSESMIVQAL